MDGWRSHHSRVSPVTPLGGCSGTYARLHTSPACCGGALHILPGLRCVTMSHGEAQAPTNTRWRSLSEVFPCCETKASVLLVTSHLTRIGQELR
ncbi:hypothetical protein E2C01_025314 [Portunus trituberculatus]|uniref:Uncharacterized protein n=1 Tax=Portunus trituberculatus TaxID=210409 RepID=A0A5B7ED10_PORTR|nr:hypothetical protein [Portunus trituberculatus]